MSLTKSELFNFIQGSPITGESVYDIWKALNPDGTEQEFIDSIRGKSALEYWLSLECNSGKTEEDFIKWLGTDNSELIAKEIDDRQDADIQNLTDAKAYTDEQIADEVTAREAANAQVLDDAKAYTDEKLAEEVSNRETANAELLTIAEEYTDKKIADEVTNRDNADAVVLTDAKAHADEKVAAEEFARQEADVQNLTDAKVYTDEKIITEETARELGDSNTLSDAKAYTDEKVATEATDREAADTQVLTDSKAYTDEKLADEQNARELGDSNTLTDSKAYTDEKLLIESENRVAGDDQTLIDAKEYTDEQIKAIQGNTDISMADVLEQAKAYTDTEVAALVGAAPETMDTLEELGKLLDTNEDAVDALNEAIGSRVLNTTYETKVAELEKADTDNLAAAKTYTDEQLAAEVTAREEAIAKNLEDTKAYVEEVLTEELKSNYDLWISMGNEGTPNDYLEWLRGDDAYQVWLRQEGNAGKTEQEFLDSLKVISSNYDLWLSIGNTGTVHDFFNSLKGYSAYESWLQQEGNAGKSEEEFVASMKGADGESAYETWLAQEGNEGKTEEEFLESLKVFSSNYDLWLSTGNEGTPADFFEAIRGYSAYETWLKQEGNEGKTEAEFLESLKVVSSNYDLWLSLGNEGTPADYIESMRGDSAYETWLSQEGNEGKSEEEFIASIGGVTAEQLEAKTTQILTDAKAYTDDAIVSLIERPVNNNILINSNFINPVNQREFTSGIPNNQYTIDRWRVNSAENTGTVSIGSDGLTLTRESVETEINIHTMVAQQPLEYLPAGTYTLSAKINGTVYSTILNWNNTYVQTKFDDGIYLFLNYVSGVPGFGIALDKAMIESITIEWAKLELGKVATPYIPRLYAEELQLCQRYFFRTDYAMLTHSNNSSWILNAAFPVQMRTEPTVTGLDGAVLLPGTTTTNSDVAFDQISVFRNGLGYATIIISSNIDLSSVNSLVLAHEMSFDAELY